MGKKAGNTLTMAEQYEIIEKLEKRYPILESDGSIDKLKKIVTEDTSEETFCTEVFNMLIKYLDPERYGDLFDRETNLDIKQSIVPIANYELSDIQINRLCGLMGYDRRSNILVHQIFSRVRALARENNCLGYWESWWDIEEYTIGYDMKLSDELKKEIRTYFGYEVKRYTNYYRLLKSALNHLYRNLDGLCLTAVYSDINLELWCPLFIVLLGSYNISAYRNPYFKELKVKKFFIPQIITGGLSSESMNEKETNVEIEDTDMWAAQIITQILT